MTDYRNPDDPWRRDPSYDLNSRNANATWGWIAGAIVLVVLAALAFGVGRSPNQAGNRVATNTRPPANQMAPAPGAPGSRSLTPAPAPAPSPSPAPANPAPAQPAH